MYVLDIRALSPGRAELMDSFLTLEQLKKGVDGYRASGGTLI
jgi:hypothetical protein